MKCNTENSKWSGETSSPENQGNVCEHHQGRSWRPIWGREVVFLVDFFECGLTLNSERYCETLKKLRTKFKRNIRKL